mgnify:FL=1
MKLKTWVATQLYRWSLAQSIIGVAFSALTFAGVFTILLSPFLSSWGLTYSTMLILLLGGVATVFLGLGFVLDRVLKFWKATALVGTARNPFLISRLYEKEWLSIIIWQLPMLRALRQVIAEGIMSPDRRRLVEELDGSIERLEETVKDRAWTIREGEDVYEDSR